MIVKTHQRASEERAGLIITAGRRDEAVQESILRNHSYGNMEETLVDALHDAALGDQRALADHLVTRGADVNAIGGFYESPLGAAIFAGHQEMVKWLLLHGAKMDTKTPPPWCPVARGYAFRPLEDRLIPCQRWS